MYYNDKMFSLFLTLYSLHVATSVIPPDQEIYNSKQNIGSLNELAILASIWPQPRKDVNLYEGDIILTPQQRQDIMSERTGVAAFAAITKNHWKTPRDIPYEISPSLQSESRATKAIADAIKEIEDKTCIRFRKKRSTDTIGIRFVKGSGCSSPVGFTEFWRVNYINLASGCWTKGVVIHEIMHTLGFWHEQSRPDRDKYVTIRYENIKKGGASEFFKASNSRVNSLNSPYDYDSILHYGTYYFSIQYWKKKTIETKDPKDQHRIGQRRAMSVQDAFQINEMYCKGKKTTVAPPTSPRSAKYFCIRHYGHLYITVASDGTSLELTSTCKSKFRQLSNQALQLINSNLCIEPERTGDGAPISLSKGCGSSARFQQTAKHSLKHLDTGKCIHPKGGSQFPPVNSGIVLYGGCDQSRLTFRLIKVYHSSPEALSAISLEQIIALNLIKTSAS